MKKYLILFLLCISSPVWAAFSATTVWNVQTGGVDGNSGNGGCFDPGVVTPGTDWSKTVGGHQTYTDLHIDASVNTSLTSSGHPFGSSDVGNCIAIDSGSGFTVQRVVILSVSGSTATVDKSLGTLNSSSGHGILGGPLATPGQAAALHVAGNTINVKAGTYSITSASTNIASGCVSLTAGAATGATRIVGYGTNPGDNGTKPLLQASGISTFAILTTAVSTLVDNIEMDGANLTGSRGVNATVGAARINRCKFENFKNNAVSGTTGVLTSFCEASGCSSAQAFANGFYYYCYSHANTFSGFLIGSGGFADHCISANNTGAAVDGYTLSNGTTGMVFSNCLAYGNGRHGFNNSTVGTGPITFYNCISYHHTAGTAYGWTAASAADNIYLFNCAGGDNTTANVLTSSAITAGNSINFVTLTASPFISTTNWALNNVSGGGKSLRWAGIPGNSGNYVIPGAGSLAWSDIGPIQHKDRLRGFFGIR